MSARLENGTGAAANAGLLTPNRYACRPSADSGSAQLLAQIPGDFVQQIADAVQFGVGHLSGGH